MSETIPVALFTYARPAHLVRVLDCLRENRVPLVYAYADGAKGEGDAEAVHAVRALLRAIDWCEVRLTERERNFGLGPSILAGVGEIASRHPAFIVWEDDLICVPGTYDWMCAALRHYADVPEVFSVSGWTHPRVVPSDVQDQPYLDARADCWVWGAYARSWRGMEETALQKREAVRAAGLRPDAYGADLPAMAEEEARKNVWAVRWLYHHLQHEKRCVRPPWSMVEHIGFGAGATQAGEARQWANPPLRPHPPLPSVWPPPIEHGACGELWRRANPPTGIGAKVGRKVRRLGQAVGKQLRAKVPLGLKQAGRSLGGWRWFRGDYPAWEAARQAAGSYDNLVIVERVLQATMAVKRGEAAYEQDGVLFSEPNPDATLLKLLRRIAGDCGGRLRVVDFGGALGTTYWRHRAWFGDLKEVRWDVVEQPALVDAARRFLSDAPIHFHTSLESALASADHDVLLSSTTLQYLPDPMATLEPWLSGPWPYVILNNLPLHRRRPARLRVQHVPPAIYPASYPVWFFNREAFLERVARERPVIREYRSEAVWPVGWRLYPSTGLLLGGREAT